MENKDPELMDYFWVIWRRKWIVGLGTVGLIIIAVIFGILVKPVYEIDAIVQPGNFLVQNQAGNFDRVVVEPPQQIADKVRRNSYDALIVAKLKKTEESLPKIEAENIKNTIYTRFWVRSSDVNLGKEILGTLIDIVKEDIDKVVEVEIKNLEFSIKANEILKQRSQGEIEILNKKLKISAQRKKGIEREMESVKGKIEELEKEQLRVLKKEDRNEMESIAMLLYSNEVQQSLQYYESLDEKLSKEKLFEESVFSAIKEEQSKIDNYENTNKNLEDKKGRIDYTKIIKNPVPDNKPVFPRNGINIFIALIAGVIIFTLIAFFVEYLEKSRQQES